MNPFADNVPIAPGDCQKQVLKRVEERGELLKPVVRLKQRLRHIHAAV